MQQSLQNLEESSFYIIDDDFTLDVVEDEEFDLPANAIEEHEEKPVLVIEIDENTSGVKKIANDVVKSESVGNEPSKIIKSESGKKSLFQCNMCGYSTQQQRSFTFHIKMHTNALESKLYKCKYCTYETFRKNSLSFHMARCISDNKKRIKCPLCSFVTLRHRNLTLHTRNMHTKNKISQNYHRCEKCIFKTKVFAEYEEHKNKVHTVKMHERAFIK
ncbi:hypothetical protein BDFB_013021 [Asbolus verrucosus]|uniref:C2H2-type domain-containing protein n=1 Tax=Asbolus verrucosus TaxID=1661398 RepID=A0A482W4X5_ASBVE|nr:hypothetical protein BDFB_013021 [Asbolus verrucosus]